MTLCLDCAGNLPWFVPGVGISIVVGLAASRPLGRALDVGRPVAWALVVALGIILSATLTPLAGAIDSGATGTGSCDLSRIGFALPGLLDPTEASGNVLMFVPLGVAIGLVAPSRRKWAVVLAAVALPFAIEAIQLLLPIFARGCESADVADNLMGLFLGLAVGTAARWVAAMRARARDASRGEPDLAERPRH